MKFFQLKIFATKVGIQTFLAKYLAMTIDDIACFLSLQKTNDVIRFNPHFNH